MNSAAYATAEQADRSPALPLSGRRRANWLYGGLGIAVLGSVVWVLFAFHVPPLQDYSEWTYQGYLLNRLLGSASAPAMIKPWPVPNSISEFALALLGFAFSPISAARALIVLYLISTAVIMALASRGRDGRVNGAKFLLLLCIGVVHAPFWTGEINYQIGLALFLLYVLLCGRERKPSTPVAGAYAVLLFFCHGVCLGLFLIYEGWRSLRQRRVLRFCISIAPVLLLAIWYKLADPRTELATLDTRPQLHGVIDALGYLLYQVAKSGPYHNFVFGGAGDYERAPALYWGGVVANLAFALCMGGLVLTWVRASWRERSLSNEFLAALSFLALTVVDPSAYLGIANVGERLIAPALMLAVISLRQRDIFERLGASLAALSIVSFVSFVAVGSGMPESGPVPANDVVSDPAKRFQVLFWHKPFTFAAQTLAAEQASASDLVPTQPIGFETSLLMRPRDRPPAPP